MTRPGPAIGPAPQVIAAEPAHLDVLGDVIAEAFLALPPSLWLIGGVAARRAVFPGYFRLITELAMSDGMVWTTTGRDAVALWLPCGAGAPPPPADYPARLAAVTAPWTARFAAFDATLEARHPAEAHWQLAILAVRPNAQGHGVGTELLDAGHQHLDHDHGTPAYLEAATRRLAAWYQRHGYTACDPPIDLPDGGPQMYPMVRPAVPQRLA
jgi:GNAT superfamily N-acetyltransferase